MGYTAIVEVVIFELDGRIFWRANWKKQGPSVFFEINSNKKSIGNACSFLERLTIKNEAILTPIFNNFVDDLFVSLKGGDAGWVKNLRAWNERMKRAFLVMDCRMIFFL
jgi:hypothetical protein